MLDREAIFAAVFALSGSVNWGTADNPVTFKTRTRRLKLFSDVNAVEQPWMGQAEHNEIITQITNQPYRNVLEGSWMVYHREGDQPNAVPTTVNNLILAAIEQAFAPSVEDPGYFDERNTLQGLVHHCYIDGTVLKDPGDIDNQALILVPFKILVP